VRTEKSALKKVAIYTVFTLLTCSLALQLVTPIANAVVVNDGASGSTVASKPSLDLRAKTWQFVAWMNNNNQCSLPMEITASNFTGNHYLSRYLSTAGKEGVSDNRVGLLNESDDGKIDCAAANNIFNALLPSWMTLMGITDKAAFLEAIGYKNSGIDTYTRDSLNWHFIDKLPASLFGSDRTQPSKDVLYYIYINSFDFSSKGCDAVLYGLYSAASADQKLAADNNAKFKLDLGAGSKDYYLYKAYAQADGATVVDKYIYPAANGPNKEWVIGPGARYGDMSNIDDKNDFETMYCRGAAFWLEQNKAYAEAYYLTVANEKAEPDTFLGDSIGLNGSAKDVEVDSCYKSGVLSWLLCPILRGANEIVEKGEEILDSLLSVDMDTYSSPGLKTAWSSIRVVSSVILVGVALIMVISQILGFELFSAYSVKKIAPRLILAVIMIQLSWVLVTLLISLFNVVGQGVKDLLFAPFGAPWGTKTLAELHITDIMGNADLGFGSTSGATMLLGVGVGGALFASSAGPLAMLLIAGIGAVIAVFTGLIVLILRQMLLVALLIFAPLGILASILPGTQKYWKLWWENLIKLLFMYPLIMGFIAIGVIFSTLIAQMDSINGMVRFFAIIIAFFAPFFLISKTFKMGGQLMGSIGGAVSAGSEKLRKGIVESKPMKNLATSHAENVKARGVARSSSENPIVKNYGRFQAGTLGAHGVYGRRARAGELKADAENRSAELADMMRGTLNGGADIDNILNATEGQAARVNGNDVKVTRRMQQAALLKATEFRRHDAMDNYMQRIGRVDPTSGEVADEQALREARTLISSNFSAFDTVAPHISRGDPVGAPITERSGSWQTAVQQYSAIGDTHQAEVRRGIHALLSGSRTERQQAVGHINSLLTNDSIPEAEKARITAFLRTHSRGGVPIDYNEIAGSNGNRRVGIDTSGQLVVVNTAQP
jgi:hypothetical protein